MNKQFTKEVSVELKGIAIVLMLLHHCFLGPERWGKHNISFAPIGQKLVVELAQFGKICVAIFVFISAYGLTKSFLKTSKISSLDKKSKLYSEKTLTRLFKLLWGFWGSFAVWQIFSFINYKYDLLGVNYNYKTVYGVGAKSVLYFITDALGLAELFKTPTFNGTWWYMSLAIIIILIMPLLIELYRRFGAVVILLAPLLPQFIGIEKTHLTRYLFLITLGILCADKNCLDIVCNFEFCKKNILNKTIKFLIATVLLVFLYKVRQYDGYLLSQYIEIMDAVVPLFVIYYCYEFVIEIPIIKQALMLIGNHSTTIFMTHTFFRAYYFNNFIYSPKNWMLVVLLLIVVSLIYSIVYDYLTEKIGYNSIPDRIVIALKKHKNI